MATKDVDRPQVVVAPIDVANLPLLQIDDIADENEVQLKARGAAYAREYARIEKAPTILLHNLATVIVAIRRQHDDWRGHTQAYRDVVAEMYRLANIPPDSKGRIQAAVRWHVGNVLRRVMTPRELQQAGLKDTTPYERQQDRRATTSALLKTVTAAAEVEASTPKRRRGRKGKGRVDEEKILELTVGHPVKATADHLRLASAGRSVFQQLDVSVIDEHMTDGQRAKLDEELAELQKLIAKLRRHTRKRRSEG